MASHTERTARMRQPSVVVVVVLVAVASSSHGASASTGHGTEEVRLQASHTFSESYFVERGAALPHRTMYKHPRHP